MIEYIGHPLEYGISSPKFIGREDELKILDSQLSRRGSFQPIILTGKAGIGKSLLAHRWYDTRRSRYSTLWVNLSSSINPKYDIENVLIRLNAREFDYKDRLHIVLDGADIFSSRDLQVIVDQILNYKVVDHLLITRQQKPSIKRGYELQLNKMPEEDLLSLLTSLLLFPITAPLDILSGLMKIGNPSAISFLSKILNEVGEEKGKEIINGNIYKLQNQILIPDTEIKPVVIPIVKNTTKQIITDLQKLPSDIHKITPRQFEEILAELLADMGYEVELTQQTRDGGSDILAYKHTPIGKLLFLVEAKRYREDRKIGVDLVKNLYANLMLKKANSAMLVTTSSFTSGARQLEKEHEFQLSLKEYEDVISWVLKYGKNTA